MGVETHCGAEDEDEEWERDLQHYARSLGLDPIKHAELMWVVREAFVAPLPSRWTEHSTEEGRVYFCDQVTHETSWFHPLDAVFRDVLDFVKAFRTDTTLDYSGGAARAIEEHTEAARRQALERLNGWSGPYRTPEGLAYYYNEKLQLSTWASPFDDVEDEIFLRRRILCRCLAGLTGRVSPSSSTPGLAAPFNEDEATSSASIMLGRARPQPLDSASSEILPLISRNTPPSSCYSFITALSTRSSDHDDGSSSISTPVGRRTRRTRSLNSSGRRRWRRAYRQRTVDLCSKDVSVGCYQVDSGTEENVPPPHFNLQSGAVADKKHVNTLGFPQNICNPQENEESGIAVAEDVAALKVREGSANKGELPVANDGASSLTVMNAQDQVSRDNPNVETLVAEFAADATRSSLELRRGLSVEDRKRAKAVVARYPTLYSESYGFGSERRLHIFRVPAVPPESEHKLSLDLGVSHDKDAMFTFGSNTVNSSLEFTFNAKEFGRQISV